IPDLFGKSQPPRAISDLLDLHNSALEEVSAWVSVACGDIWSWRRSHRVHFNVQRSPHGKHFRDLRGRRPRCRLRQWKIVPVANGTVRARLGCMDVSNPVMAGRGNDTVVITGPM